MTELLSRMNVKTRDHTYRPRGPKKPRGMDGLSDIIGYTHEGQPRLTDYAEFVRQITKNGETIYQEFQPEERTMEEVFAISAVMKYQRTRALMPIAILLASTEQEVGGQCPIKAYQMIYDIMKEMRNHWIEADSQSTQLISDDDQFHKLMIGQRQHLSLRQKGLQTSF